MAHTRSRKPDAPHLLDGKYSLKDLIDLDRLSRVFADFSSLTGLSAGIISHPDRESLIQAGQQRICTQFHRAFPASKGRCGKSNQHLFDGLTKPSEVRIARCENGLMDGATPIVIEGNVLGFLITGQVFLEKPDRKYFEGQALEFGYDPEQYLKAVNEVPVVTQKQMEAGLSFFCKMAVIIAEEGLNVLRTKSYREELEKEIRERKKAENHLRQSEESYRGLFNSVSDAIYIQDREGRFLDVNDGAAKMYGYPREYLVGRNPADLSAPGKHDPERVKAQIEKTFQGIPQQFEFWGVRRDGGEFITDVRLDKGTYFGQDVIIAVAQDITERKNAQRALQRQLKELSILHAISLTGTQSNTVDELVARATGIIVDEFRPDSFGIMLLDPEARMLRTHATYHGEFAEDASTDVPVGQGVTGYVAATGKPYLVGNVLKDERYISLNPGMRSELCVPIQLGNELIGVINAESRLTDFFSEDDLRLFITIGSTLATAIEKIRLFEVERKRRQDAETLRDATTAMTATLELHALLASILESLEKIVPHDSASIVLRHKNELEIIASRGLPKASDHIGKKFTLNRKWETIISTKQALILPDAQTDPLFEKWDETEHIHGWMGIPLLARGEVIGCICLDSLRPNAFHKDQSDLLQTFANQAAAAIENVRLFEAEQRHRQEAEALRQAAQVLSASLDVHEVFRLMLEQLKRVLTFDSASVILFGESGQLDLVIGLNYENEQATSRAARDLLKDSPILKQMGEDLKPLTIADVRQHPGWIWVPGTEQVRAFLAVPIVAQQRMIGTLMMDSRSPGFFTDDDVRIAQTLAQHMAIALENARLYGQAVEAAERRAILHRASQEIAQSSLEVDEVYQAVHRAAGQLMPAEAFVISVVNETSGEISLDYLFDKGEHLPPQRIPLGSGLSGQVVSSGEAVIIHDLQEAPLENAVHFGNGEQVRSILAVPMRLGKKVTGMLSAQSYAIKSYTQEDQRLLEMLAAHAAVAIENARLNNETRKRLMELEVVNRISISLRAAETTQEMLPRLLGGILGALQSDAGAIWLYDFSKQALLEMISRGWFDNLNKSPIAPGEGIAGMVFETGETFVSREFVNDPRTREQIRSVVPPGWGGVCIPIRTSQEIIGVLFTAVQLPRQIQPEEVHLLTTISEIAGNAIRRSDLHKQTQRQVQRLASLRAIDMAINTILDLRVTLGILIDHILSQLKVDAVDILLLNSKTKTLQLAANAGVRPSKTDLGQVHIGDDIAGKAVRSRSTIFIKNLRENTQSRRVASLVNEQFVSYFCVPLIAKGQVKGVLEILHRSTLDPDAEWKDFMETLAGQAALAIDNAMLFEELQKTNIDLALAYDATIEGWSKALDLRDQETEGHTQRVVLKTIELAQALGISADEQVHIRRGALLHDIGKMGVPDKILFKTGPLTDQEWGEMRLHPVFAYEMLHPITYLHPAMDIPYCHHERWNGTGYPRGLRGEEIPLAARLFAAVDIWDALTSDRPYRKAWSQEAAFDYIRQNSGILLDPRVVDAFLSIMPSK